MYHYLDKLYDALSAGEGKSYDLPEHIEKQIFDLQSSIEEYLSEVDRLTQEANNFNDNDNNSSE